MNNKYIGLGGTGNRTRFFKANNVLEKTDEPYFILIDSKEEQNNMQDDKITYSEENKNE